VNAGGDHGPEKGLEALKEKIKYGKNTCKTDAGFTRMDSRVGVADRGVGSSPPEGRCNLKQLSGRQDRKPGGGYRRGMVRTEG